MPWHLTAHNMDEDSPVLCLESPAQPHSNSYNIFYVAEYVGNIDLFSTEKELAR